MFVNKFLFCIDLKWAALVIGGVDIILSLLAGLWLRWMRRAYTKEAAMSRDNYTQTILSQSTRATYLNRFGHVMYSFLLVVLTLHICSCIMLIISSHSGQKSLVAPYISTSLMRFVMLLLILIWIVSKSYDSAALYWIIGLSLGTFGYFWLTALSWFQAAA